MARIAVLDANVLWPQYLRDVLIRAAVADLYRAAWTDRILEEMRTSLIRKGRVSTEQIDRTVRFMREQCPHFMVEGYENLIGVMMNDEKDRHVLAAAVRGGAYTIVTSNTKDFSPESREPYGIDLHTPNEFLEELWVTDSGRMANMLVAMAGGLKTPPLSVEDLVDRLGQHAPGFAAMALASDDLEAALEAARAGITPPAYRLL
jgi:predicted nucleic acid-binding protein